MVNNNLLDGIIPGGFTAAPILSHFLVVLLVSVGRGRKGLVGVHGIFTRDQGGT